MHETVDKLTSRTEAGGFSGLRLTADEYFTLPDDGARYELIDGIVTMSPSASFQHQLICGEIYDQIKTIIRQIPSIGVVVFESDVLLEGVGKKGDLVYRPDLAFLSGDRSKQIKTRIRIAPDLIVEIISPESRSLDTVTKFHDYARAGVGEYWIIDPLNNEMHFYSLKDGKYEAKSPDGDKYVCPTITGLALDLPPIRKLFSRE
ncbi:MAG: Uma2 family endonuclease [Phycisphaerae bacterium]